MQEPMDSKAFLKIFLVLKDNDNISHYQCNKNTAKI